MEITIHSCSFSEERRYRLNFNGKYDTDLNQQPTMSPVFERNVVRVPCVIQRDTKSYLFVSLLALNEGKKEIVLNSTAVDISDEPGVISVKVDLAKSPESDITGTIYMSYKHIEMKLFALLSQGSVSGIHATCSLLGDSIHGGSRRASLNERDINLSISDLSGRLIVSGRLPHVPVRNMTRTDGGRSVISTFLHFSKIVSPDDSVNISLSEGSAPCGSVVQLAYCGTVATVVRLSDGVSMVVTYKYIHNLPRSGSCVVHELAIQDALLEDVPVESDLQEGLRAHPNWLLHLEAAAPLSSLSGDDDQTIGHLATADSPNKISDEDAINGIISNGAVPSSNSSSSSNNSGCSSNSNSSSSAGIGLRRGAYLIPEFTLSGSADSVVVVSSSSSSVDDAAGTANAKKTRKILANAAKLKSEKAVLQLSLLDPAAPAHNNSSGSNSSSTTTTIPGGVTMLGSLQLRAVLIDVHKQQHNNNNNGHTRASVTAAAEPDDDANNPELTRPAPEPHAGNTTTGNTDHNTSSHSSSHSSGSGNSNSSSNGGGAAAANVMIIADGYLKEVSRHPGSLEGTYVCMLSGTLTKRSSSTTASASAENSAENTTSTTDKEEEGGGGGGKVITVKATLTVIPAVEDDPSVDEGRARCLAALDNALGLSLGDDSSGGNKKSIDQARVATPEVLSKHSLEEDDDDEDGIDALHDASIVNNYSTPNNSGGTPSITVASLTGGTPSVSGASISSSALVAAAATITTPPGKQSHAGAGAGGNSLFAADGNTPSSSSSPFATTSNITATTAGALPLLSPIAFDTGGGGGGGGGARFGDSLNSQVMSGQKQVAGTGHAIAELIKSELTEKQKIIDKLLDDATVKDQTMASMSAELKGLRDKSSYCESCMFELEAALRQRDTVTSEAQKFVESTIKTPAALGAMRREDLLNVITEIGRRYKAADTERLDLKRLVTDAQSARRQYVELQKIHKELQDAHMLQNQYIQKMQKKQGQVKVYEATIQMQEKVIKKMQKLVESKFRDSRRTIDTPGNDHSGFDKGTDGDSALLSRRLSSSLLPPTSSNVSPPGQEEGKSSGGSSEIVQSPPAPIPVPGTVTVTVPTPQAEQSNEAAGIDEKLRSKIREYEQFVNNQENKHREEINQLNEQHKKQVTQLQDQLRGVKKIAKTAASGAGTATAGGELSSSDIGERKKSDLGEIERLSIRIDELEAEVASKSFRIAALEEQLVISAQESSREIAKLRTKLFEIEISAAIGDEEASFLAQDFSTSFTGEGGGGGGISAMDDDDFETKPWSREGRSVLRGGGVGGGIEQALSLPLVPLPLPSPRQRQQQSISGGTGSTGSSGAAQAFTRSSPPVSDRNSASTSARGIATGSTSGGGGNSSSSSSGGSGVPSGTAAKAVAALRQQQKNHDVTSIIDANALLLSNSTTSELTT